jgi:hypothetical protein
MAGTGVCSNINECDPDPCQNSAFCTETSDGITLTHGVYHCACPAGYTGTNCEEDINECDPDPCKNDGECTETDGTTAAPGIYHCNCPDGYDGIDCETDINECTLGTYTCATHATCTNIVGGYSCTCNAGFVGDGTTCTDIDECEVTPDICFAKACRNTQGGFICGCETGYHYHPEKDQCYKNICYCEHGEAEKVCQIDQAEACDTCDDGFVGRQCLKESRTLNSVTEWGWFPLISILLSVFAGFWIISLTYLWLVNVYAVRASTVIPVDQQNKNQQNKNQPNKIDLIF